jgi:hypothetical protein
VARRAEGPVRGDPGESRARLHHPRQPPHAGGRRDHPRLAQGLPARRLRRTPAQTARRSRSGAPSAAARRGGAARRQGGQPRTLGATGDPRRAPTPRSPARAAAAAGDRASPARSPWPDGHRQDGIRDPRSAPLCLRTGRGAVDERCDARPGRGGGGAGQTQDLPDRLHRRCDPRDPLRDLCPVGEHRVLSAGARAGDPAPRPAAEALHGQRCELPLHAAGPGLRQARHRADPRPALPTARQGQDRALVQDRACAAADPADRGGSGQPRSTESPPRRLDRRGVSPHPASRPGRRHPARAVGAHRRGRALPRTRPGSGGSVPARGGAQGPEGPHGQPARRPLRGRRRPGRGEHHPAL